MFLIINGEFQNRPVDNQVPGKPDTPPYVGPTPDTILINHFWTRSQLSCNKKNYADDMDDFDDDEDIHRVVADHLHLRLASNLGHIGTHLKWDLDGRRGKKLFYSVQLKGKS